MGLMTFASCFLCFTFLRHFAFVSRTMNLSDARHVEAEEFDVVDAEETEEPEVNRISSET